MSLFGKSVTLVGFGAPSTSSHKEAAALVFAAGATCVDGVSNDGVFVVARGAPRLPHHLASKGTRVITAEALQSTPATAAHSDARFMAFASANGRGERSVVAAILGVAVKDAAWRGRILADAAAVDAWGSEAAQTPAVAASALSTAAFGRVFERCLALLRRHAASDDGASSDAGQSLEWGLPLVLPARAVMLPCDCGCVMCTTGRFPDDDGDQNDTEDSDGSGINTDNDSSEIGSAASDDSDDSADYVNGRRSASNVPTITDTDYTGPRTSAVCWAEYCRSRCRCLPDATRRLSAARRALLLRVACVVPRPTADSNAVAAARTLASLVATNAHVSREVVSIDPDAFGGRTGMPTAPLAKPKQPLPTYRATPFAVTRVDDANNEEGAAFALPRPLAPISGVQQQRSHNDDANNAVATAVSALLLPLLPSLERTLEATMPAALGRALAAFVVPATRAFGAATPAGRLAARAKIGDPAAYDALAGAATELPINDNAEAEAENDAARPTSLRDFVVAFRCRAVADIDACAAEIAAADAARGRHSGRWSDGAGDNAVLAEARRLLAAAVDDGVAALLAARRSWALPWRLGRGGTTTASAVRIVVRLATLTLSPACPVASTHYNDGTGNDGSGSAGGWRLEGSPGDGVVGVALLCVACDNVAPPAWEFRAAAGVAGCRVRGEATGREWLRVHCGARPLVHSGLRSSEAPVPTGAVLGTLALGPTAAAAEGTAVVYPSFLQRRPLRPPRLVDPTQPGRLTMLSLLFLDPGSGVAAPRDALEPAIASADAASAAAEAQASSDVARCAREVETRAHYAAFERRVPFPRR